jgi:hypothetical protein
MANQSGDQFLAGKMNVFMDNFFITATSLKARVFYFEVYYFSEFYIGVFLGIFFEVYLSGYLMNVFLDNFFIAASSFQTHVFFSEYSSEFFYRFTWA